MARNRIEKIYCIIGNRIRAERKKKGLSQEELAKKSNLERPSVVLIENGRQKLPIDRLYLIASALELHPHRLLPEPNEIFATDSPNSLDKAPIIIHKSQELKPELEKELRDVLKKSKERMTYET